MLKILLATTAMTLLGSGAAFAEGQYNNNPVVAQSTVTNVTVSGGVQSQTQAVGNVLSVNSAGTYTSVGDTQKTADSPATISSTSTTTGSTISGVSSLSTLSIGNDMEINPGNSVLLQGSGGAGGANQSTVSGSHSSEAETANTSVASTSFTGDTSVNAASVGDNLNASSVSGTVGLTPGFGPVPFSQLNGATQSAAVVLTGTNVAGGVLNSQAQSIGNSASLSGIITAGSPLSQTNNSGQTAVATLSGDNLLSSGVGAAGNSVTAAADGDMATIGQTTTGTFAQTNTAAQVATLGVGNSTVNGAFSAQAAGNVLSFTSNTTATVAGQSDSGTSTSNMNVGPVNLNAATSFGSLAIGNQFAGTLAPTVDPFTNQSTTGAIAANSTVTGVNAFGNAASVDTTATANLATMTAPGTFEQTVSGSTNPTAIATISNSSFTGGLTAATAAIGNSISIK